RRCGLRGSQRRRREEIGLSFSSISARQHLPGGMHMMGARLANIPDPKNFDDPDKLRNLMANAHRLGHDDLVLRCQIRIAELGSQQFDDDLEKEFWTAVHIAEEFKTAENGKTTR